MRTDLFQTRGPAGLLAFVLVLVGCVEGSGRPDGLYYSPPQSTGQETVSTALSPAEVAKALQAAGLGDVRLIGESTVRLGSKDPRLVDCGMITQVALGNVADVPGNAPKAVFIEGFVSPEGLIERDVSSVSEVRLTRLADGSGYAIDERHKVTRRYDAVASPARSTSSVSFDEMSEAAFPNKTSCRSSGYVANLLR
ncbi:hypothetical protein [Tabrizicola sp.]|uniref:hypothetical protein n=1 Tax=Tabrizicola sp. TaxID=2005166 RepID=UPI003F41AD33